MFLHLRRSGKNSVLKITIHRICEALIIFFVPLLAFAQLKDLSKYKDWNRYNKINQFYQLNNFRFGWMENKNAQNEFLGILNLADSFGLNQGDYQFQFFKTYNPSQDLKNLNDSIDADVRLTDAAIHFFSELKFGNRIPSFGYTGLPYDPASNDNIPSLLLTCLKGSLKNLIAAVEPKATEFISVLHRLNWFLKMVEDTNFEDAKITSKNVDETNRPLLLRLYQLGITDTVLKTKDRKIIIEKLKKAQSFFDLLNDGTLRSTALAALNIPLKQRIEELRIALNYLRWTEQIKQTSSVLLLNIPSAYFMVYDKGKIVLDSKVIVGKPSTPTPTLTSTITQVILYPFWNVPYKIATKELLPSIKRSIEFLESGSYQVLNNEGKVLDPYKINWKNLSANYFPYHIRQSTGCDNALGIVKFEFYNPFTVYLHDTPSKGLFSFSKRYFSHGCMRVEKPVELAHLLLGSNRIAIDTLTAKGCLYQQAPKPLAVEKELPVIILYSTVWYNKEGEIKFYDDVYGKLNR
jgi:murein L,D-transpeptidase YcbB/YkuD